MRPTLRCLLLFVGGFAAALLPVVLGAALWPFWVLYVAAATLLAGADAVLALPPRRLETDVEIPPRIPIGDEGSVHVVCRAASLWRRPRLRLHLDLEGDVVLPPDARVVLDAQGRGATALPVRPTRRGRILVRRLWLRWTGPIGLMSRIDRRALDATIAVVPNTPAARQQALRVLRRRDAWVGLKAVRHVGEGSEFDALREYVPGLDSRGMNWKASARHRRLITTDFRAERNHQVVLALDTGHLMREPLEGIPRLDHAVIGALSLALVSLRHGDRVGLYAFDADARMWVEPRGGVRTFARLQHATADLEDSTAETNFTLGLANLTARLHRRSLVVLLTDFTDTVTAELMVEHLGRLARRHVVTFVTLRNPALDRILGAEPRSAADLHRAIVADDFIRERDLVLRRLRHLGIFCIDAAPQQVSTPLINRYLEVKRRELVG